MNGLDRRGTDRDRTRELDKYGYVEVDRGFDEGYPDGESRDAAFMDVGDPSGAAALPGASMPDRTRWIITAALIVAALVCWVRWESPFSRISRRHRHTLM